MIYRTDTDGLDLHPAVMAMWVLDRQAGKQEGVVLVIKDGLAPVQIRLAEPDQALVSDLDSFRVDIDESSHADAVSQTQVDIMAADNVARACL